MGDLNILSSVIEWGWGRGALGEERSETKLCTVLLFNASTHC